MALKIEKNISLSTYTSFGVGGNAENLVLTKDSVELVEILSSNIPSPIWIFGFGSNVLISDKGLSGLVVCNRGGKIEINDEFLTVDSGVWWDDVVQKSIDHGLWGIELLSEIPGSIGAATFINIAAYGQSIGSVIEWVEAWNAEEKKIVKLNSNELLWSYKDSFFQKPENRNFVILRVCLRLSKQKTTELEYQKSLDVADELNLDAGDLSARREIITEARKRAGSIWHPNDNTYSKTVGSFFRNPIVDKSLAESIIAFDETGKTAEQIRKMNRVHGGNSLRVSAAHVMLASGFRRGQTWEKVKLNNSNLLKIEALPGATAQDIYNVVRRIQDECMLKHGIKLVPEAQILGKFD